MRKKSFVTPQNISLNIQDTQIMGALTYLGKYKVRLAEDLLKNTKLSLPVIAQELGVCNTNYFSTVLKKENGMSPIEYKKKNS